MLHCSMVVVKMPNTFTYEEYTNIHSIYCFCSGNGRNSTVEYQQLYPLRRIPYRKTFHNIQRILRGAGSFPWVYVECEQWWHGEDGFLAEVQQIPIISIHRISRTTGIAQTQVWRILHHGFFPYHLQRVQHHLPRDNANNVWFVNGCNQEYTFCMTFSSRMWLNLPRTVLPTQGIALLEYENLHEVTKCHFQHEFSVNMWCGVLGWLHHTLLRDV
jgi:hypothetical protein